MFVSPAMRACVDVGVIDDSDVEGDHHFELVIDSVAPGSVLASAALTTITITDNLGTLSCSTFKFNSLSSI